MSEKSSASGTATAQAPDAVQLGTPDLFQLEGGGISITFHPVFVGARPQLVYQDPYRTLTFRGDEIRRVEVPDLGSVISVTIVPSVDTGTTTFSLLLPQVSLPNQVGASTPISTEGITTVHRFSPVPAGRLGQREVYTVTPLHGTASLVIIPL